MMSTLAMAQAAPTNDPKKPEVGTPESHLAHRSQSTLDHLDVNEKTLLFELIHKYPNIQPTLKIFSWEEIYRNHLYEAHHILRKNRELIQLQYAREKQLLNCVKRSRELCTKLSESQLECAQQFQIDQEKETVRISLDIAKNIEEQKNVVIVYAMMGWSDID